MVIKIMPKITPERFPKFGPYIDEAKKYLGERGCTFIEVRGAHYDIIVKPYKWGLFEDPTDLGRKKRYFLCDANMKPLVGLIQDSDDCEAVIMEGNWNKYCDKVDFTCPLPDKLYGMMYDGWLRLWDSGLIENLKKCKRFDKKYRRYVEHFDGLEKPKLKKYTEDFKWARVFSMDTYDYNEFNKYRYLMNPKLPFTQLEVLQFMIDELHTLKIAVNQDISLYTMRDHYVHFLNHKDFYHKFLTLKLPKISDNIDKFRNDILRITEDSITIIDYEALHRQDTKELIDRLYKVYQEALEEEAGDKILDKIYNKILKSADPYHEFIPPKLH